MTPLFQYELLNQPFGDPVLYVRLEGERRALLFDLGEISSVQAGKLFKVSHVFVTHMHMDHFIGFDHLVRLNLARDKTLRVYGPAGIIRNVRARLQGYTWDLVGSYPFVIEVFEITARQLKKVRFVCSERFQPGPVARSAFQGIADAQPHYIVRAMRIDHKIGALAFSLEERFHIHINKVNLQKSGLPVGKWLGELKGFIREGRPDTWPVRIESGLGPAIEVSLGELKRSIVTITKGQKIVYIADCRGIEKNFKALVPFAAQADVLFCEAAFLDRERERASMRGHLTARQAGWLARQAGAKRLHVFHFSPRYEHCPDLLRCEAQGAFEGLELQ